MAGLAQRLGQLEVNNWQRWLFLFLPSGILPALSLLAWRGQDQTARAITFVTVLYFLVFYVLPRTALHYFVPVMLLPHIVFWRHELTLKTGIRVLIPAAAGAVIALALSLPEQTELYTAARTVGSTIEDRIGGYENLVPSAFRSHSILQRLFPPAWQAGVPLKSYGGSALSWYYYAHHKGKTFPEPNYVLQLSGDVAPAGMSVFARTGDVVLYIRSRDVWKAHRALRPAYPPGSRLYLLPRKSLFPQRRPD